MAKYKNVKNSRNARSILTNIHHRIRSCWRDLFIIKELAVTDFRLRYKNAFFGYLWSVATPLIMLVTLYLVFSKAINLTVPHYQLFLLLGIILWNFFAEATTTSMNCFIIKKGIINTMKFPKHFIVIASCLTSIFSFLINLLIFFLFEILSGIKLSPINFLLIINLINLFLVVLGTSFFLSVLYPRFRDVSHLWNILILIGFWITPIIYKETQIPQKYLRYYMLNPMARLINEARDILIYHYCPEPKQLIITATICIAIFLAGILYFKRKVDYVAEEI